MSMEIKRNYNTPISNYANNTERSDGIKESTVELKTPTPNVTKTAQIKTGFKSTKDYLKYLQEKYPYVNIGNTSMSGVSTTVTVSDAFLKKCMNDPEKAKYLEENLAAIPDCVNRSIAGCVSTVTNLSYNFDANGEISIARSSTHAPNKNTAKPKTDNKAIEQRRAKEKIEAKRKEKAVEEKRIKEKRSKEKQNVTASGSNVWRATENLKNELSLTDFLDMTSGFDMKV